jgi:hypothetical protein
MEWTAASEGYSAGFINVIELILGDWPHCPTK